MQRWTSRRSSTVRSRTKQLARHSADPDSFNYASAPSSAGLPALLDALRLVRALTTKLGSSDAEECVRTARLPSSTRRRTTLPPLSLARSTLVRLLPVRADGSKRKGAPSGSRAVLIHSEPSSSSPVWRLDSHVRLRPPLCLVPHHLEAVRSLGYLIISVPSR